MIGLGSGPDSVAACGRCSNELHLRVCHPWLIACDRFVHVRHLDLATCVSWRHFNASVSKSYNNRLRPILADGSDCKQVIIPSNDLAECFCGAEVGGRGVAMRQPPIFPVSALRKQDADQACHGHGDTLLFCMLPHV